MEINVFPRSLSFWLGMLRWPLLDGTKGSGYGTGGDGGAGGGGGGGGDSTQRRGSSGSGGQPYDDNTGCRSLFFFSLIN